MATRKVTVQGNTILDLTDATRSASDILNGKTAYGSDGSKLTGTISPSTPVSSTISSKDTVITVPRGYYTSNSTVQIASAEQSKIIANNIRSGVTILGIGGSTNVVNTGDANATRADIASGKTRYVGGTKITGTGSGGSGKNAQVVQSTTRATSSSYTKVCGDITVSKTGTYNVYWSCFRSSTSGTWGSQLYINGSAYGSAQSTFSNHISNVHLSNVSLTANQTVAVYARSRGSNYYAYVGTLTLIEA